MKKSVIFVVFMLSASLVFAQNATIVLANGDTLNGEIIEKDGEYIVREIVSEPEPVSEPEIKDDIVWKKSINAGYSASQGNTKNQYMKAGFDVTRKDDHVSETSLKGDISYSSSDRVMDAQRWQTTGRYGWSFGGKKDWYHFISCELSHDRFSHVYYRFIPTTGIGWWIFDIENTKLLIEAGIGLERTDYYGGDKTRDEVVAVPRLYFQQKILDNITVSQDLYYYPYLKDLDKYRLSSTSKVSTKVTDGIHLNISIIDEYNSSPPKDTKGNDLKFITSVTYEV